MTRIESAIRTSIMTSDIVFLADLSREEVGDLMTKCEGFSKCTIRSMQRWRKFSATYEETYQSGEWWGTDGGEEWRIHGKGLSRQEQDIEP